MRSRPANASVICVPMFASWMTGIVMSATIERYHTKSPMRHRSGADGRSADEHHRDADGADDDAGEGADGRHARQRLRDVAEQTMRAFGEDELFALFCRVRLDDADAAERFAEAARHFRIDLAAFAEERTQAFERRRHADAERQRG